MKIVCAKKVIKLTQITKSVEPPAFRLQMTVIIFGNKV